MFSTLNNTHSWGPAIYPLIGIRQIDKIHFASEKKIAFVLQLAAT